MKATNGRVIPGMQLLLPYKSLAWLIGQPLKIIGGISYEGGLPPDGLVRIVDEWPNTVMLEMEFIESRWGLKMPPRIRRQMIPKASIACGDVVLATEDGRRILPEMLMDYGEGKNIMQKERTL